MATLTDAELHLYDAGINGVGYQVAWEVATEQYFAGATSAYQKTGQDLLVERRDFSTENMTENKMDGLYWSSQRSWFGGDKQERLDDPNFSDPEQFLKAKNCDIFDNRGVLKLSNSMTLVKSGESTSPSDQFARTATDNDLLYWTHPNSANTDETHLFSISDFSDTPQERTTGFTTEIVDALTTDGEFLYAGRNGEGIRRGDMTARTTTLSVWSSQNVNGLQYVKERLMAWEASPTSNIGVRIHEITTDATPVINTVKDYGNGYDMEPEGVPNPTPFFAVHGFIGWIINGPRGAEVWLWDGTTTKLAALLPLMTSVGVQEIFGRVVYNNVLFPVDSGNATTDMTKAILRIDITGDGIATWDILHTWGGRDQAYSMAVDSHELYWMTFQRQDEWQGLTSDSGVSSGNEVRTIASLNLVNEGLNLSRFWGREAGITGELLTPAEVASLIRFQGRIYFSDSKGNLVGEDINTPYEDGELIASASDHNIDADKTFLIGQLGAEGDLPTGTSAKLQYAVDEEPDENTTWTNLVTLSAGEVEKRARLGSSENGEQAKHLHMRTQLNGSASDTPEITKTGTGAVYSRKPTYDHVLILQAYDHMELRNGNPWPGNRGPDTIQSELETLRDNNTVIDFQEPLTGGAARASVKAQVRAVEAVKRFIPQEGWANLLRVQIRETPN